MQNENGGKKTKRVKYNRFIRMQIQIERYCDRAIIKGFCMQLHAALSNHKLALQKCDKKM